MTARIAAWNMRRSTGQRLASLGCGAGATSTMSPAGIRCLARRPIFFQSAIERAAAEAERRGGLGDLAATACQSLADQRLLHLLERHVIERAFCTVALRKTQIWD